MSALTEFTEGYTECLIWQGLDWTPCDSDQSAEPEPLEEAGYSVDDIESTSLAAIEAECEDFYTANLTALESAHSEGMRWDYLGHDFCLTRNHHGAGFWDRGLGELGKALTEAAHPYGESGEYVHSGQIWVSQ